eukprot:9451412-Alexandrium_andersonii.AAC.1
MAKRVRCMCRHVAQASRRFKPPKWYASLGLPQDEPTELMQKAPLKSDKPSQSEEGCPELAPVKGKH